MSSRNTEVKNATSKSGSAIVPKTVRSAKTAKTAKTVRTAKAKAVNARAVKPKAVNVKTVDTATVDVEAVSVKATKVVKPAPRPAVRVKSKKSDEFNASSNSSNSSNSSKSSGTSGSSGSSGSNGESRLGRTSIDSSESAQSVLSCDHCGREFKRKGNLTYHTKNNVCRGNVKTNDKQFKCRYCAKGFTTSTSMYRHMNHACRIKKSEDNRRDEIFKRLLILESESANKATKIKIVERENESLKAELNNMKHLIRAGEITEGGITNNGIINNGELNVTNITMNNVVVAFGKEDPSKIGHEQIVQVLRHGFDSAFKLTDAVHFNPSFPEFHNVYIPNMKSKYVMTYDGTNWGLTDRNAVIDKLYNDKRDYIEQNLEEFLESLTESRIRALRRWLAVDEDHDYIKKVKENIKLLLYNKRALGIAAKKTTHRAAIETSSSASSKCDRDKGNVDTDADNDTDNANTDNVDTDNVDTDNDDTDNDDTDNAGTDIVEESVEDLDEEPERATKIREIKRPGRRTLTTKPKK